MSRVILSFAAFVVVYRSSISRSSSAVRGVVIIDTVAELLSQSLPPLSRSSSDDHAASRYNRHLFLSRLSRSHIFAVSHAHTCRFLSQLSPRSSLLWLKPEQLTHQSL